MGAYTDRSRLVMLEWIFGEGRVGLALSFYLPKTTTDATELKERLLAMPLPRGATERVVHIQRAENWPRHSEMLHETLATQQAYADAILAGIEADRQAKEAGDGEDEEGVDGPVGEAGGGHEGDHDRDDGVLPVSG